MRPMIRNPMHPWANPSTSLIPKVVLAGLVTVAQFAPCRLPAQAVRSFRHFTTAMGLPDREVNRVVEDAQGFMWVATNDGLARFDGGSWDRYRQVPGDENSLCGNMVTALAAGSDGKVWVGTDNGHVCAWEPDRARFTRAALPPALAGSGRVLDLLPYGPDHLYVSIEKKGLHRLDLRTGEAEALTCSTRPVPDRVLTLYRSGEKVYAGGLGFGLMRIEGTEIVEISRIRDAFARPAQTIATIHADGHGRLWLGGWDNGLYVHVEGSASVAPWTTLYGAPYSPNDDEITAITATDGLLWLGSKKGGLHLLDTASGRFQVHQHRFHDHASIASNSIRCLFTDSRGMVWVGTDQGLDLFDPAANHFRTYWLGGDIGTSDLADRVTGIVPGPGGPVVSSMAGVVRSVDARFGPVGIPQGESGHALHRAADGGLLVGTQHGLLRCGDDGRCVEAIRGIAAPALEPTRTAPFVLPSSRITAIAEVVLEGRRTWALSVFGYGVGLVDATTGQGIIEQLVLADGTFENMFNGLLVDRAGRLWFMGRNTGLSMGLRIDSAEVARALLDGSTPCAGNCTDGNYLTLRAERHYGGEGAPGHINGMAELPDGSFLVATADRGLQRFLPGDPQPFRPIVSLHNKLESIQLDGLGRAWCVADGGLDVYDPGAGTWLRIDPADGLPEKGVQGAIHVLATNDFAVGSFGGFVRFDPSDIKPPTEAPVVRITHFKVFDRPADSLLSEGGIRLDHTQNFLRIAFTSFAYGSADKHRYHWQLIGVDPAPVDGGTRTEATYTNLKGGDFHFRVWAVNSAGLASAPVELAIAIVPPFWERWWFFALIAALIAAAFYGAYRYRIGQLQHMQQLRLSAEIDAQEKERKRIARDLHDDLGTRISTLKLYMGGLHGFLVPGDEAREVERTAVEILDASVKDLRNMLNDLSPETVSRYGYVRAVEELARHISNSRVIEADVAVAGTPPRLEGVRELALYRVTQELFNNSIRHSGCTQIHVRMLHSDGRLEVLYEDNGKGMTISTNGTGHGLRNITNRLQLIGGTITWDSAPGQGLRAIIHLTV